MIKCTQNSSQPFVFYFDNISCWKTFILIVMLTSTGYIFSQPPPPCYANGNSGFGGAVGEGHILFSGEFGNPINFNMYTGDNGTNEMSGILVLYIDTGVPGRNQIDFTIDDSADDHRIAISNSNAFGNGSVINFPAGFEASHAIAVDVNFGGLWSIPSTGSVGLGGLNFITSVNSTLISSTQVHYDFNFNWEDIGLVSPDEFSFVGLYVSDTAYSSDEGYGEGITIGTEGSDTISFSGYLTLPGCTESLNNSTYSSQNISAYYYNDALFVNDLNETARISVYDIQGRKIYSEDHQIEDTVPIPLALHKNELQFIIIESSNKNRVLKVIPN